MADLNLTQVVNAQTFGALDIARGGPLYFAYVNRGTAFDPTVHNVFDEEIYSFDLDHSEGDFCGVDLELKNPRVGLLNDTRQRWAWMSLDTNWPHAPNIVPLMYGRVVGMPDNLQNEVVSLTFLAKPYDLVEQKAALAEARRAEGAPKWSPIWFDDDTRNDPENILQSCPELWDFNRTTHEVTTTNITNGEDGTLSFTADEVYYDGMSTAYGDTPLTTVRMKATVDWEQAGSGVLEIGPHFNFGAGGGLPGGNGGGPGVVLTYTGKGLVENWLKAGAALGPGWRVEYGAAIRVDGMGPNVYYTNKGPGSDTIDNPFSYRVPFSTGPLVAFPHQYEHAVKLFVPLYLRAWITFGQEEISRILAVMRWRMGVWLNVRYEAKRRYTETISITISADTQEILTDTTGDDTLDLTMTSSNITSPIDPGGALPIGDLRNARYFSSDRGAQDIEYLIAVMRARLLMRARAVDITFAVPPLRVINDLISCRMDAAFPDPRFPGTTVGGKIKNYKLKLDGDSGEFSAEITIGCMVGKGGAAVEATAGEPCYVVAGVLAPGIQRMENKFVMPFAGEVIYKSINGLPPNDDGFNLIQLDNKNCVKSLVKENGWAVQEAALSVDEGIEGEPADIFKRLEPYPTRFTLTMRPGLTGGPFLTERTIEVSDLIIQKTIDLEADAV